ncbi:MAG: AAA family ATPase [Lachnospiraceae bacterium]|nr:AAA family ATPase [Lachnospiraceae bacterium]
MVFYDFTIDYDKTVTVCFPFDDDRSMKWNEQVSDLNEQFGYECGLDGGISAAVVSGTEGSIHVAASCRIERVSLKKCKDFILETIKSFWKAENVHIVDTKEIGAKDIESMIKRADNMNYISGHYPFVRDMGLDYFTNSQFHAKERCFEQKLTKASAVKQADMILGDNTLYEELNRIFAPENKKKFYGHPVHYKLTVGKTEAAMDIVKILVPALRKNGRLLGNRVIHIYDVEEGCYDETDMDNLFEAARGNTVVIELAGSNGIHGNYASSYEQVIEYFDGLVKKYGKDTLCIFIECTEHPGFSESLISKVQSAIDLIEIKEGCGDYERACKYFIALSKQTDFPATEKDAEKLLPRKTLYTATEVYGAYRKWYGNGLKSKVYTSYQNCAAVKIADKRKSNEPYEELQKMVGLTEIKKVVDQIIAMGKVTKLRSSMGMDTYKTSLHMIFTGNPGSAKTTVARRIAQILKKEGVLDTGNFVECGRSDLVAKYVGWTAKQVKRKFFEAKGGILFIDEAYALVDESQSFGDEAINTIVQEMENYREDVIVIFAGYPEKMQDFLGKNEGLRSRIAFHLNFPDYNAEELLRILHLQVKQKGYHLSEGVDDRCLSIFEEAVKGKEFGNGRFVRNLLEQAMMKQAERTMGEYGGEKVLREYLMELKADDFDVNVSQRVKEKRVSIGFGR